VHAHEAGRSTGGARGDGFALEDEHAKAAPCQVEGQARTLDAGTDHDHVGRFSHVRIMTRVG
jgi:hypothetical protein